eukprot:TRINITY_DN4685_c0_g4_i2.p2 TRINITY_DN4685_c0_g4~~TRINITY_DN4685_c0_g4_i2.p2  ORF type:complete len:337 (+),score=39.04 TRINITY_DN4685_c0_g4_i2:117-1127(+)
MSISQDMYQTVGGINDNLLLSGALDYFKGKGKNGFGSSSTADQVCSSWDGSGKTAIVTGASAGLGAETVKALAGRGCHVIMAARNTEKCQKVADEIKQKVKDANLTVMKLDLADLVSVKQFCDEYKLAKLPLNILICNAGVMACPFTKSAQGHEMQFATNHLGHFVLVHQLKDLMKETAENSKEDGRVVCVSSGSHYLPYKGGFRFGEFDEEKGYSPWLAYGQSKLANILFARELHAKFSEQKWPIKVTCLHPGGIQTELQRHQSVVNVILSFFSFSLKSIPQGAATQVFCATSKDVLSGEYYQDCNVAGSSTLAHSKELGKKLWEVTEEITKEFL